MTNQIKKDKEKIILGYIIDYPTHGPRRIANELAYQGIKNSDTGVYHILCRRKLNHRLDRLFYAQDKSDNPLVTERYLRKVAKKKPAHIKAYYPGYLFCQDTFYIGTIKGLGRIYQRVGEMPMLALVLLRSILIELHQKEPGDTLLSYNIG